MASVGNRLLMLLKAGDQDTPGRQNMTFRNGMPVMYWDESERGVYNCDNERRIFLPVEVNRSYLEQVKVWCDAIYAPDGISIIRKRPVTFDFDQIAQLTGYTNLKTDLFSPTKIVDVVTLGGLPDLTTLARDTLIYDFGKKLLVQDINAITSGTYGIATGSDYSTITSFEADFGTLTGNINGELRGDVTDTAPITFDTNAAGYKVTINSNTPHNGLVTAGWKWSLNSALNGIVANMTNDGEWEVYDFTARKITTDGTPTDRALIYLLLNTGVNKIHDMFLDGNGKGSNLYGANIRNVVGSQVYNVVSWGWGIGGLWIDNGSNAAMTVENCVLYSNTSYGLYGGLEQNIIYNNIACLDNGSSGFFGVNQAGTVGNNCISTDLTADDFATETDFHNSVVTADEVISTDDTSENFMRPKSGGNMETGGKIPTNATVDMRNVTYASSYPVGAYQYVGGGISADYQARNLNYSTMQRGS